MDCGLSVDEEVDGCADELSNGFVDDDRLAASMVDVEAASLIVTVVLLSCLLSSAELEEEAPSTLPGRSLYILEVLVEDADGTLGW